MARAFIGTSGFSYPHWKGVFYPQDLPSKEWLSFYRKHFNTVEINSSFYRLPTKQTFAKWQQTVGKKFVFAIKASRFITHIKRLKDCQSALKRMMDSMKGLKKNKQQLVLFQLPARFKVDTKRLKQFISLMPESFRSAFEFRHQSWLSQDVAGILKQAGAAFVFQDYARWPVIDVKDKQFITAEFVYRRFHGKEHLYSSSYSKRELRQAAQEIKQWLKQGLDVYAYFNNDALGYAVNNAQFLKNLIC